MKIVNISIFCASSMGFDSIWAKEARRVGNYLADQQRTIVYGGGHVGLMGEVADGALENGGRVIGVIPYFLSSKEIGHPGLTELIVVDNMHERKLKMHDLCDAAIAMPGGFGTLEEIFEMITWAQLGLHTKPVGLLNTNGFYNHLITFIQEMVNAGLLKKENQEMVLIGDTIEDLLRKMENYQVSTVPKWLNLENS